MKNKKLKEYCILKNGSEHGTVKAYSKKEAKNKVFAAYGEHREIIKI